MWDDVFAKPGYHYGIEPAAFLTDQMSYLRPGMSALSVADGEGRNSVFLAREGLKVTAMDGSEVALDKARSLAAAAGVTVDYRHGDIASWDWDAVQYDVVLAIFAQFAGPEARTVLFEGMKRAVRPGGVLMLHGYTPAQLAHGTGGPRREENLYTPDLLQDSVAGWNILRLEAYERELHEGKGHAGPSALIDLIARKPL